MRFRKNRSLNTKGFTLPEVVASLIILALITSSVLVVVNRCIKATIDENLKVRAFEIARENMEKLLARTEVSQEFEEGMDEDNPEIEYQVVIEPFPEPATSNVWLRAVSSATYVDSKDEQQTTEFTHWLRPLSKEDLLNLLKQREMEIDQQYDEIMQVVWQYITEEASDEWLIELYNEVAVTDRQITLDDVTDIAEIINALRELLANADEALLAEVYEKVLQAQGLQTFDLTDLAEGKVPTESTQTENGDGENAPEPDNIGDETQDGDAPDEQPPTRQDDNLICGYTRQELLRLPDDQLWEVLRNCQEF